MTAHPRNSRASMRVLAHVGVMASLLALLLLLPTAADAASVTVSGRALSSLDSNDAWSGCASGHSVSLAVEGVVHGSTTCNATTGAYTFSGVSLTGTQTLTLYLDPASGSDRGVTYLRNTNDSSNVTNLHVSRSHVRMKGAVTTAHVNSWDNSNRPIIPAISDGTTLTTLTTARYSIVVESGASFTPLGTSTVDKVNLRGTWNAGSTLLVIRGTGENDCTDGSAMESARPFCRTTGTFNAGTGTVRFTMQYGAQHTDVNGPFAFHRVEVHPYSSSNQYLCIANANTVTAAEADFGNGNATEVGIWDSELHVSGTVTINGATKVNGNGRLVAGGNVVGTSNGRIESSVLRLDMAPSGGTVMLGGGSADWDVGQLSTSTTGTPSTIRLAAGTGDFDLHGLAVGSNSTLDNDTNDRRLFIAGNAVVQANGLLQMSDVRLLHILGDVTIHGTVNSNGGPLTINGYLRTTATANMNMLASDVSIGWYFRHGGTYTVVGAGRLELYSDFSNEGTFNAGVGEVEFVGTYHSWYTQSAPTTFHDFENVTPGKVVRMSTDHVTTINGTLRVRGASCSQRAALASQTDGETYQLAVAAADIRWADIGYAVQTTGTRDAVDSFDSGDNAGWNFAGTPCPAAHVVSGRALEADGVTPWAGCGALPGTYWPIGMSVNGYTAQWTDCDPVTGAFTFTTHVEPNRPVTVFLDPAMPSTHGSGASYVLAPNPIGDITNVDLRRTQVRLSSRTASAITNAHIDRFDDEVDDDLPTWVQLATGYTEFASNVEVVVEAGSTYAPQSETRMEALEVAGTLGPAGPSTQSVYVEGAGTDASCDAALGTSVPVCIRPGGSIAMNASNWFEYSGNGTVHVAAASYPNLALLPSSGTRTYQLGTSPTDNVITVAGAMELGTSVRASTTSFSPDVSVGDDLDVFGNATLTGSGTGTFAINDDIDSTGNGVIDLTAGTFQFAMTSDSTPEICESTSLTFRVWNLLITNASSGTRTVSAAANCGVLVRNQLQIGRATDSNTSSLDLDSTDLAVHVDGDVLITSRGNLRASSAHPLVIGGSFQNSGSFTANRGLVDLDTAGTTATVSGSTTFANLRVAVQPKTVRFQSGAATRVTNTFTVTGSSCVAPVTLAATTPGTPFSLRIDGSAAFQYATLADSTRHASSTVTDLPLTGNLGGNSGWTFSGGCDPGPDQVLVHDTDASTGTLPNGPISAVDPHVSVRNVALMDADAQQVRVMTTPLTAVAGLWRFDTAPSIIADASGNGHDLSMTGTPSSPTLRPDFAQSLRLDGTAHATVTSSDFTLASNFTVEAWIRMDDIAGTQTIVERAAGTNRNYSLRFASGQLEARVTRTGGTQISRTAPGATFTDGEWHHVALVMTSGNALRLFVDGTQVGTDAAVGGTAWNGAAALSIGGTAAGGDRLTGDVDDVRVSSAARSAAELLGYVRARRAHGAVLWTSSQQATTCTGNSRCADVIYDGDSLLRQGARYYAQGRVHLQAWQVWSEWGEPSWFETVEPTVELQIPDADMTFADVMPGAVASDTTVVRVMSDAPGGYELFVSDEMDGSSLYADDTMEVVADFGDWNATDTWDVGEQGAAGVTLLTAAGKDTTRWGTATTLADHANIRWAGPWASQLTPLHVRTSPTAGWDDLTIGYRASLAPDQPAGTYTGTLTFTATAAP